MYLCVLKDLRAGEVRRVPLGTDRRGRPVQGLMFLDLSGEVRGFVDRCRHLPIGLDAGGRFLTAQGTHLQCRTHGALFRCSDGLCESGPCLGLSLFELPLVRLGDELHCEDNALQSLLQALG